MHYCRLFRRKAQPVELYNVTIRLILTGIHENTPSASDFGFSDGIIVEVCDP